MATLSAKQTIEFNNNNNFEFNVRFGVLIGDVADEFMPLCQRVHATTVTVYMAAGI